MSQNQTEYFRQYREKNRDRLKAQQREYYLANKEQINARNKAYYHENKEAVKQAQRKYVERTRRKTSEYQKSWREQNVLYIKQYHKRYYLENREEIIEKSIRYQQSCPKAKAAKALRRRLYSVIRTKGLYSGTKDLLGCSFEDFRDYIEAQFKGCMSWDNYGRAWNLDHIIPCAAFDLSNPDQVRQCFHFTNIRPLWRMTNLRKNKHITDNQLRLLL